MALYAATIFLSAFLLFQVQTILGKFILPWFGGTPAVWTTCMLFFQTLLLGGYIYAHVTHTKLRAKAQGGVHLALIVLALIFLPIVPDDAWKAHVTEQPVWVITLMLGATVGLPFFVLSSTGPLLQAWFARVFPERSPYPLYALSNAGSLLALASYPFAVETTLSRTQQAWSWSGGFVAFGVLCGLCAWRARDSEGEVAPTSEGGEPPEVAEGEGSAEAGSAEAGSAELGPPSWGQIALWIGLAAMASTLLLAITNQLCLDVASTPFLWVLPLSIYLLSFIFTFSGRSWYRRTPFAVALLLAIGGCYGLLAGGAGAPLTLQVGGYSAILFVACMVCHGELYDRRPHPRHLTTFYVCSSTGGALGGVLVGVVSPLVFPLFLELQLGLILTGLLALVSYAQDREFLLIRLAKGRRAVLLGPALWLLGLGMLFWDDAQHDLEDTVAVSRNFYGVLRVRSSDSYDPMDEDDDEVGPPHPVLKLLHGRISHGTQYVEPERRDWATTYYDSASGVGKAMKTHKRQASRKVGVIGLGTGTLLAYAGRGDRYRIYEIDRDVLRMAQEHFTYIEDARAKPEVEVEFVLGDGRISLEREEPQGFDLLVVDAFSSDAIPVHLLTDEAVGLYVRHMAEDGVLAVHVSNRHLDLKPVVWTLAEAHDLAWRLVDSYGDKEHGGSASLWFLLSPSEESLSAPRIQEAHDRSMEDVEVVTGEAYRWTDDYSNLFGVLKPGALRIEPEEAEILLDWLPDWFPGRD